MVRVLDYDDAMYMLRAIDLSVHHFDRSSLELAQTHPRIRSQSQETTAAVLKMFEKSR